MFILVILEPHIFSCLTGFPGRSSLNLYYHVSFYSFKSFFYKLYFKDDGLLPSLIAALGRKSRPAVRGSWNAAKILNSKIE